MALINKYGEYYKLSLDKTKGEKAFFFVYESKQFRDLEKETELEWGLFLAKLAQYIEDFGEKKEKKKKRAIKKEKAELIEVYNKLEKSRHSKTKKTLFSKNKIKFLKKFGFKEEWLENPIIIKKEFIRLPSLDLADEQKEFDNYFSAYYYFVKKTDSSFRDSL